MDIEIWREKHVLRNISIFTLSIIALGWLGWLIGFLGGNSASQGIGQTIWLISPLGASVLLRIFAGDGWKDLGIKPAVRKNGLWYGISILVYPVVVILILLIGRVIGAVSFPGFSRYTGGVFFQVLAVGFVPMFIKNIFEEFGWRGYLAPKMFTLGLNDMTCHVIVGVIWAVWHLPYYFGLMDSSMLRSYTALNLAAFIPLVFIGLIAASILYGEIRRLTGSVWPAVLMHTISNTLINTLIVERYIEMSSKMEFLVTPGMEGILSIVLITSIGICVYKLRIRSRTR